MLRKELIDGVRQVQEALEESNVLTLLREVLQRGDSPPEVTISNILSVYRHYSRSVDSWNEAAHKVASLMNLSNLNQQDFWALLSGRDRDRVHSMYFSIQFVLDQLPHLIALLTPEDVKAIHTTHNNGEGALGILSVYLIEEAGILSRPQRAIDAISGVIDLYEGCAEIEKLPSNELAFLGCDSGSDKSFDFLGHARIMTALKDLILSMWDRIVFYREKQVEQRVDLVARSLPILDGIKRLEEEQALGREQAELLRRKVIDGATKFLSCGATIPEIENHLTHDPRVLLAPAPRLLTAASYDERPDGRKAPLSADELQLLEELSQRAAGSDIDDV